MIRDLYSNRFFITVLLGFFLLVTFVFNFSTRDNQQFVYLARSFLNGKLHFLDQSGSEWLDAVRIGDKYYWPEGPFPAVVLMPFVGIAEFFGSQFFQGYLQFFITLAIFFISFLLARKFRYSVTDSLILAFAFGFGSVYFGIAIDPSSWRFAQSIAVFLLFLLLYEFFTRKRYWILGLILAVLLATRPVAALAGGIFLFLELFLTKESRGRPLKQRLLSASLVGLPVLAVMGALLWYNYARFGQPLMTGYETALASPDWAIALRDKYGLFSYKNILTNFYFYFLNMPHPVFESHIPHLSFPYIQVSPLGISLFVVSPLFLKIFFGKYQRQETISLWIASFTALFVILSFEGSGFWQFGPRYTLDFLPLWFSLLLFSFLERRLNRFYIFLILGSGLLNLYLYFTLYFPQSSTSFF